MYFKTTLYLIPFAVYCTVLPLALPGQSYYRNDRLEQRHPDYRSNHGYRSYRGDSRNYRNDHYRSDRYRDHDRYNSRSRYQRNDCRRDDRHRRHRHRGLFDIRIRI